MRIHKPFRRFIGISLLIAGFVLLTLVAVYYTYTFLNSRNFNHLIVQQQVDVESGLLANLQKNDYVAGELNVPLPSGQALYPGAFIPARLWSDQRGTLELGHEPLLIGFTAAVSPGTALEIGPGTEASRMIIPALKVDTAVTELMIVDLENSREYETPKLTVGHIPGTPNPGVIGNGWYFGHLESPLQREGNVFGQLPQVPTLLANGEDIFIIIESRTRQYLYQVSETDLIHKDQIWLYQTGIAQVTLVTCFPRLKYDHRLLVTAKLVGFKELGMPAR